jgi:hypothetical protein
LVAQLVVGNPELLAGSSMRIAHDLAIGVREEWSISVKTSATRLHERPRPFGDTYDAIPGMGLWARGMNLTTLRIKTRRSNFTATLTSSTEPLNSADRVR